MPRVKWQAYLDRLDFVNEHVSVFDLTGYDVPPDRWSGQMKSLLTEAYHVTKSRLDQLDFIRERRRDVDLTGYDAEPDQWSRQMKSRLTRNFNEAMLANATDEYATQHDYKTMAKLIRPVAKAFKASAGYRLDEIDQWTPAQKGKLTRYFKKAIMRETRPNQKYITRDKKIMREVAELVGEKGYPEFNRVAVPAPPRTHVHYNKRTKTLTATGERIKTATYYWHQFGVSEADLIADPAGVVTMVVAQLPHRKFAIKAGDYSVGKGVPTIYTRRPLANRIAALMEKYGADAYDPDDPNSHYWGNWLDGLHGYDFADRQAEQDFVQGTYNAAVERKRYKRALVKKVKRKPARKPKWVTAIIKLLK